MHDRRLEFYPVFKARYAGPDLLYEVVRDGRRLFSRDDREADTFEHRAAMQYLDTAYYRDLQQQLARDAVE